MTWKTTWCGHTPRAGHPRAWGQVGLRKHHYEHSPWRWWNSSQAIANSKRWCCSKCWTQYTSKFGKLSNGPRTGKGQFSFYFQRTAMPKNVQITVQLHLFHMLTRWYAKSFKLGCSSTWTENFPMYKLGLEKAEGPEIKLSTFTGSWRKQGNFRKTCNLCFTDYTKAFVQITTNCGKFWEMGIPDHLLVSWETCTGLKKQQLEPDMEQRTGSILGKEYNKGVYCHPADLTYMQSSVQSFSHVQLFATPWITAHQTSLSITNSRSPPKPMSIESVMPSSHLILCHPLLNLPPIPPSIRVFSNRSTLCMRGPKYWSFSFSISPSTEHPGLISFRMD